MRSPPSKPSISEAKSVRLTRPSQPRPSPRWPVPWTPDAQYAHTSVCPSVCCINVPECDAHQLTMCVHDSMQVEHKKARPIDDDATPLCSPPSLGGSEVEKEGGLMTTGSSPEPTIGLCTNDAPMVDPDDEPVVKKPRHKKLRIQRDFRLASRNCCVDDMRRAIEEGASVNVADPDFGELPLVSCVVGLNSDGALMLACSRIRPCAYISPRMRTHRRDTALGA